MSGVFLGAAACGEREIVAATDAPYTGYSTGSSTVTKIIGRINNETEHHGYTIDAIVDSGTALTYAIEGNHTGAQFTSIVTNGVTFLRADADDPNGTYDAGSTSTAWAWSAASPSFVAATAYIVYINA